MKTKTLDQGGGYSMERIFESTWVNNPEMGLPEIKKFPKPIHYFAK
ncbi:MAG: hypothetical protein ACRERV_18585 [Methylococcales bacterium]